MTNCHSGSELAILSQNVSIDGLFTIKLLYLLSRYDLKLYITHVRTGHADRCVRIINKVSDSNTRASYTVDIVGVPEFRAQGVKDVTDRLDAVMRRILHAFEQRKVPTIGNTLFNSFFDLLVYKRIPQGIYKKDVW